MKLTRITVQDCSSAAEPPSSQCRPLHPRPADPRQVRQLSAPADHVTAASQQAHNTSLSQDKRRRHNHRQTCMMQCRSRLARCGKRCRGAQGAEGRAPFRDCAAGQRSSPLIPLLPPLQCCCLNILPQRLRHKARPNFNTCFCDVTTCQATLSRATSRVQVCSCGVIRPLPCCG